MREYFNGCPKGCEESLGSEQPAFVDFSAAAPHPKGMCMVTSNPHESNCIASHPETLRICPCQ
jgi:hypothetical protein